MGVAIAAAAARRGWPTTLLLGPIGQMAPGAIPDLVGIVRFESAAELAAELTVRWPRHDILIMAAAVADYRPVAVIEAGVRRCLADGGGAPDADRPALRGSLGGGGKLVRGDGPLLLELAPVPDILAAIAGATRPDQATVGFALEAGELRERARSKLARKSLDAIVANPLPTMDSAAIEGWLLRADGSERHPPETRQGKEEFAAWLLGEVEGLWRGKRAALGGRRTPALRAGEGERSR